MVKQYSLAAYALAAAIATGACAPRSRTATAPARGGYALSDSMAEMCLDDVTGLIAKLEGDSSLGTKGIEINIPSREYGTCITDSLLKQKGREFTLSPTSNPVYFVLTQAAEKQQ